MKFSFTKLFLISPRDFRFHQDNFDFTKIFSTSPRYFWFHQDTFDFTKSPTISPSAIFTKCFTKRGVPLVTRCKNNYVWTSAIRGGSTGFWLVITWFLGWKSVFCQFQWKARWRLSRGWMLSGKYRNQVLMNKNLSRPIKSPNQVLVDMIVNESWIKE